MVGLQNRSGWLGRRTSEITGNERRSLGSIDGSLVKVKDNFRIFRLKVNFIRRYINNSPKVCWLAEAWKKFRFSLLRLLC